MNIQIQNMSMTYKTGKTALSNINLEINSPNFIGLLGPNGAGKSTFMKLLVSQMIATTGEITVDGHSIRRYEKELRKQLGYLPQTFGLYDELTVYEFLDYMCALKEIKNNVKTMIGQVIEKTNLQEKRNVKIKTLSGGQRQRVGIAQVMLGNPELIILDEPTVGLDPEERIKFRNIFSQTASDKIVLLSTHIIDDIKAICNRIIIINKGTILYDGTSPELIQRVRGHVGNSEPSLEDAYTYVIHHGGVH